MHAHITPAEIITDDIIRSVVAADALNRSVTFQPYRIAPGGTPGYPCLTIGELTVFVYAHPDATVHIAARVDGDHPACGDGDSSVDGACVPLTIDLGAQPCLCVADHHGRQWITGRQAATPGRRCCGDLHSPPGLDLRHPAGRAIADLFIELKTTVDDSAGGWNGGDTVSVLGAWFQRLGIDPDSSIDHLCGLLADPNPAPRVEQDNPEVVAHPRRPSR